MWIESLRLEMFRNIMSFSWSPHRRLNILWGENGQGKTSVLEAVYFLANQKSFRTARLTDLIQDGATFAKISAQLEQQAVHHHLEYQLGTTHRLRRLDGKTPESSAAVYELLRPILFTPDDVGLMKNGPQGRRDLLDRALFSLEPGYLRHVLAYLRVVRHRNQVLRRHRQSEQQPWDEALVHHGATVRQRRRRFIEELTPVFCEVYSNLVGKRESADLCYVPAWKTDGTTEEQQLQQELDRVREQEVLRQLTLAGPQRDDLVFLLNGREGRRYASQGQQRSLALAFKIALAQHLETKTGEAPLLLLDDLASELDAAREDYMIHFLSGYGGQVMITTTEPEIYRDLLAKECQLTQMAHGQKILS